MTKITTKCYSALIALSMLLVLSIAAQAQYVPGYNYFGPGETHTVNFTTDTQWTDEYDGVYSAIIDNEDADVTLNANEFNVTLTSHQTDIGEAMTVSSLGGRNTFTGNKFTLEAKGDNASFVYGIYSYGDDDDFQSTIDFQNIETVIDANTKIGQSYGIYSIGSSAISSSSDITSITSYSENSHAYGILANGYGFLNTISFDNTDSDLDIIVTAGWNAYGLNIQSGSEASFANKNVYIYAYGANGTAAGVYADRGSIVNFTNDLASAEIIATTWYNTAYGVRANGLGSAIGFATKSVCIDAYSEEWEAIGVSASYGDVYFNNVDENSNFNVYAFSGDYDAYGLESTNGGVIDVTSNLINVVADGGVKSYSLYASNLGLININPTDDVNSVVTLVGDVYSDEGTIYAALLNENSYLRGLMNEDNGGVINMLLANGGRWQPTGDANSLNQAHLTIDGGVVDLAWWNNQIGNNPTNDFRIITLDTTPVTITNNGITLVVNSDVRHNIADKLVINELAASSAKEFNLYIQLGYDPILAEYAEDHADPIIVSSLPWTPVLEILNSTGDVKVNAIGLESVVDLDPNDIYLFHVTPYVRNEYGENGEITGYIAYKIDHEVFEPGVHSSLTWAFRTVHDNLWSRVGDLRRDSENMDNGGVWARFFHSEFESENRGGAKFNHNQNGLEVGFDNVKEYDYSNFYYGLFGSYLNSVETYSLGSGQISNLLGGFYLTRVYDNGQYFDFVGRIGEYKGNYDINVLPRDVISGRIKTWMASLSGEYGIRSYLGSDYFVEPQVQFIAGRIGKFDNVTNNGLMASYSNNDSLIGRFGVNLTKEFRDNKLYLTGSLFHDFSDSPTVTVSDGRHAETIQADDINTWGKLALGTNLQMSKDGYSYLEVSRLFANRINDNWRFIVGARFVF